MKTVAIIGDGRFGRLLAEVVRREYTVVMVREGDDTAAKIAPADVIILAVPISAIESVLIDLAPHVSATQLVMDVCSVKVHPAKLMRQYLPDRQILGSHPLFGPDSAKDGLTGLKVVLCPLGTDDAHVREWQGFWQRQGTEVVISTPEEHDKQAAYSQAWVYCMARMVQYADVPDLEFSTRTYDLLQEVGELSAQDSPVLFHDMLAYNPYFDEIKRKLEGSYEKLRETFSSEGFSKI